MSIQFHQTRVDNTDNQLVSLIKHLERHHFTVNIDNQKSLRFLPSHVQSWEKEMTPSFRVLHCFRQTTG